MKEEQEVASYRIKVEFDGTVIEELDMERYFSIGFSHSDPVLFCGYSSIGIYHRMAEMVREMVALREATQSSGYTFKLDNPKAWKKLVHERPELIDRAKELLNSTEFRVKFWPEIASTAVRYSSLVSPDAVSSAVENSIEILITQTAESAFERSRLAKGLSPRKAKDRQAGAVKRARKLASSLSGMSKPGRRQGSKSECTRFAYSNLREAILAADMDEGATQAAVAARLGFNGINADDQLRAALRRRVNELKGHGHKGHRWKELCREILDE